MEDNLLDLSSTLGLIATVVLTINLLLGILLSTAYRRSSLWKQTPAWVKRISIDDLHNWTAYVALALALAHPLLLLPDKAEHYRIADILFPSHAPHQPVWTWLGTFALYAVVLVIITTQKVVKNVLGFRAWKNIHLISYGTALLFVIHGIVMDPELKDRPIDWLDAEKLVSEICGVVLIVAMVIRYRWHLRHRRPLVVGLLVLLTCSKAFSQQFDSSLFRQLHFRFIGPDGNRAISVVGVPGDRNVSYVGAASGGIFKTEDAGITWHPIFDSTDNSSIGALAIAPTSPRQVWAGTGETFLIRPAEAMGNGVYKSTNAGKTWTNMGLQATGRISRIIVDPTDSNTVYVAALGNTHRPQQERGVYKTTDGGKTWERVLFVDTLTGCSDLAIDPRHPGTLYAAMWQISFNTWMLKSGGPGSGIFKTTDGGKTWTRLSGGLPGGREHPVGKTSVDVAYSNPDIVYALVEDKDPALYRSSDAGLTWKKMFTSHSMAQRASYYTRVRVSTGDPDDVFTICVTVMESKNGGKSFNGEGENGNYRPGGDTHDMWFDPKDPSRAMVAHDGCMNMTYTGGKSWQNVNLPIAQMYHVSVDNQVPYFVYGNRQDGSSYRGPSNSLQGGIPTALWTTVGGCESGFAQPDPVDNNIIWSGCYDGGLDRTDLRTGNERDVRAWPEAGYGYPPSEMRYRWHWNYPMTISRHDHNKVYIGSQYVHVTTNGGQSWTVISPDLTTNDKSHQQSSGGASTDNLFTFDGCTLYVIAESPVKAGILWTGSNDGLVHVTQDDGGHWTDVTANIPGLPKWSTIRAIDPSPFDAGTAYLSADAQFIGDFNPYIYKTTDFGKTWTILSGNFPRSNMSFVHQIIEDPGKKGLLWAGTDNALYFSPDDGGHWIHLKNNLPPVPIYGLTVQREFKDLVIGTYGRGFYILDDITPIREFSSAVQQQDAYLFSLRKAWRFRSKISIHGERSFSSGQNPPYGADINYYLRDTVKDTVKVLILDEAGNTIQQIDGSNKRGVNRVWWDLGLQPYVLPPLRTRPEDADWVKLDSNGERAMVIYDLDIGPGLPTTKVLPGTYTVVLKIGDKEYRQPVEVLRDPHTAGSEEDIQEQFTFGKQLYGSIQQVLHMIDTLEIFRSRADSLERTLGPKDKKQRARLMAWEKQLYETEGLLHDVHATGAREDIFRNPAQLLERFLTISKESINGGADWRPTDQHREVYSLLSGRLVTARAKYVDVLEAFPRLKPGGQKLIDSKMK
ncbi:MAG TPA: ferric reductase-like transmembrane domain-containing protein [Puia sp.]|nr:ferric reductase-like transmembrane domain-containing protein [Puia sp.]